MSEKNRLGEEKSPYLLQHKDNPVHWYAWGQDAFDASRKQNKIIFLSIGYSTCHWCHVMAHDSFEKEEVARVLNKNFISIKVDREERPDVDQIYMEAVMSLTGSGGWPLSVFLTPDLKPFFGGTFFWKDQFIQLLNQLQQAWQTKPQEIKEAGHEMTKHLAQRMIPSSHDNPSFDLLRKAHQMAKASFDLVDGGFGGAPKFPRSTDLSLLLRIHRRTKNEQALAMVNLTLDKMARGGIYDHLGFGFHRYSTDHRWLVPHFEKMLYDNALLAVTYLEAFQVTKNQMDADVARQILDYVWRDMTHKEGGFYSAEDADSEGEEGKFYVWSEGELQQILTMEEFEFFKKGYGIIQEGNFEHQTNILHLSNSSSWEIKQDPLLQKAHQKLFEVRKKRIHPTKDDKILTDWNGLMIMAMAKGYQVFKDPRYLLAAQNAAHFIEKNLYQNERLLHRYRKENAGILGLLNDYAYLMEGLIHLYESDFNPHWIEWALALQKKQDELFWDDKNPGYFLAPPDSLDLIVRNKEWHDGAIPSGNSVAALNLLMLHDLTLEPRYLTRAEALLKALVPLVARHPPAYSQALIAMDYWLDRSKEIAVVGSKEGASTLELLAWLHAGFFPNQVVALGDINNSSADFTIPLLNNRPAKEGQTTVYVCEKNSCKKPTTDIKEAKLLIEDVSPYDI